MIGFARAISRRTYPTFEWLKNFPVVNPGSPLFKSMANGGGGKTYVMFLCVCSEELVRGSFGRGEQDLIVFLTKSQCSFEFGEPMGLLIEWPCQS